MAEERLNLFRRRDLSGLVEGAMHGSERLTKGCSSLILERIGRDAEKACSRSERNSSSTRGIETHSRREASSAVCLAKFIEHLQVFFERKVTILGVVRVE